MVASRKIRKCWCGGARQRRSLGRWPADLSAAQVVTKELAGAWHEVVPSNRVRQAAERLLRLHPLRAADSLQLPAALIAAAHDPSTLEMVCLDERPSAAARREGFAVIDRWTPRPACSQS